MKAETRTVLEEVAWVLGVLAAFVVVALVLRWNAQRVQQYSAATLDNVRSMLAYAAQDADQAERLAETAPRDALLNANYALVLTQAARHLVNYDDALLERLSGTDIGELVAYLQTLQQRLLG